MALVANLLKRESVIKNLRVIDEKENLVAPGGKLLRPLLVVTTARYCGCDGDAHTDYAAAIELLHNSTLFHDDVIDAASVRRGRPSINARFGDHIAILAGDHFIARSFALFAKHGRADIVAVVSECLEQLVFGQLKEMDHERDINCAIENYHAVIDHKTASLVRTCVRIGARAANASVELETQLAQIGFLAGRLFQIADDVIDYLCDEKITGKRQFQDLREGKATMPVILLAQRCSENEKNILLKHLGNSEAGDAQGKQILDMMIKYDVFKDIEADYKKDHNELEVLIRNLPENEYTTNFRELMDRIVGRLYKYMN